MVATMTGAGIRRDFMKAARIHLGVVWAFAG